MVEIGLISINYKNKKGITMVLEEVIYNGYLESINNKRKGDKEEELKEIRKKILNAKKIVIITTNTKKYGAIKEILEKIIKKNNKDENDIIFEMVNIPTNFADLTRTPAINKCLIGVDITDGDIVIGRGRLGVPGSGSMLIIMDNKGRILTGALSPSSVIHKKDIEECVREEITTALHRIGIEINNSNTKL